MLPQGSVPIWRGSKRPRVDRSRIEPDRVAAQSTVDMQATGSLAGHFATSPIKNDKVCDNLPMKLLRTAFLAALAAFTSLVPVALALADGDELLPVEQAFVVEA